jgi:hypothetical protein
MSGLRPAAMNLAGTVEHPESGGNPYAVAFDGRPYLPTGDAGVVLGIELGDRIDATDTDHVAPGFTVVHADPAARHALTSLSCVGNPVVIRSGAAAGATGFVVGKRGEAGRVIVSVAQDVLATVRPGDAVSVRAYGQGATLSVPEVSLLNLDPRLLPQLPISVGDAVEVGVRCVLPSKVCGNGIGRPAHAWDVDLTLPDDTATLAVLHFGDLVAVTDLDARANLGYRRGVVTVGVIVHGPSPLPGHGPGFLPLVSGPAAGLRVGVEDDHVGVTAGRLLAAYEGSR